MLKTILITGCSSGIGYQAAKQLRERNWRVFATCRQNKDCKRLNDEGFESFQLDYSDEKSIASAIAKISALNNGKLDVLFNNGAYALPGAVEDLSRAALRRIFETNFFGQIDLMNQALPLLRNTATGRVIFCSSVLGFTALPYRGAYNASKFAIEAITDTIRREKTGAEIKFILLEPGPIKTNIRQNSRVYFERDINWRKSKIRPIYENIILPRIYEEPAKKNLADYFELQPEAVVKSLIHAAESSKPKKRYFITLPTYFANLAKRLMSTTLQDFIFK